MAIITAVYTFDLYDLDLNEIQNQTFGYYYDEETEQEYNNITYHQSHMHGWNATPEVLRGMAAYSTEPDLVIESVDDQDLIGGSIEMLMIVSEARPSPAIEYLIQDISLSAADLRAAKLTPDRADDLRLFDSIFAGDDQIKLSDGNERLDGKGGNDSILGGGGDDTLLGGSGNDTLRGEAGNDRLYLDSGNDVLSGGSGTDAIYVSGNTDVTLKLYVTSGQNTGMGIDTIVGIENVRSGGGNDIIHGNASRNVILGGDGNDHLYGREGNDLLRGGNGHDALNGGTGNDTIYGGAGADYFYGGAGDDVLYGEAGNDRFYLGAGNDKMIGGSGTDVIYATGSTDVTLKLYVTTGQDTGFGIDTISGVENARTGRGNDVLHGNLGDNVLVGGAGSDRIFGRSGNDLLKGDEGNDIISDGAGNDLVYGGAGKDFFHDGSGNDTLFGQSGNDRFYLGQGNDLMDGGSGTDAIYALGNTDVTLKLYVQGAQNTGMGLDTIRNIENVRTGSGDDVIHGSAGNNFLIGGSGDDSIIGRHGNDLLHGEDGNDVLYGGTGSDTLNGGAGNDLLSGGAGKDYLRGGAGADVFKFLSTESSSHVYQNSDIILDFQQGQDVIDLSVIDASVSRAGNNAFTFRSDGVIGTGTEGVVTFIHLDRAGTANDYTVILLDTDSDTTPESRIRLSGLHDLTADDFIL